MYFHLGHRDDADDNINLRFVLVGDRDGDGKGLYGFVDKTGKGIVPCIFEGAGDFPKGWRRFRLMGNGAMPPSLSETTFQKGRGAYFPKHGAGKG